MKTRLFLIPITLLIAFTLTTNSFAQDPRQRFLPEDAKAPIRKLDVNDIKYSPDGKWFCSGV